MISNVFALLEAMYFCISILILEAIGDHKCLWGHNYWFCTNFYHPVGILEYPSDVKFDHVLLNLQESVFGFSNSSITNPISENIKVDYDGSVSACADISRGSEIRWAYDF